jgi:hypothetical protein
MGYARMVDGIFNCQKIVDFGIAVRKSESSRLNAEACSRK